MSECKNAVHLNQCPAGCKFNVCHEIIRVDKCLRFGLVTSFMKLWLRSAVDIFVEVDCMDVIVPKVG